MKSNMKIKISKQHVTDTIPEEISRVIQLQIQPGLEATLLQIKQLSVINNRRQIIEKYMQVSSWKSNSVFQFNLLTNNGPVQFAFPKKQFGKL